MTVLVGDCAFEEAVVGPGPPSGALAKLISSSEVKQPGDPSPGSVGGGITFIQCMT